MFQYQKVKTIHVCFNISCVYIRLFRDSNLSVYMYAKKK